jgi:hypothetical protein
MERDISMSSYIYKHCEESMNSALTAVRYPVWERNCSEFTDTNFVYMGLLRCLSSVDSGRHFLQNAEEQHDIVCPLSTYFNALHSRRRAEMLKAVSIESYKRLCSLADEMKIDYLNHISELGSYDVEAADGHFIAHACHTPKNDKDKVFAAGFIYAMNLRNGFLNPICKVTNGTKRSHEIPCFKNWVDKEYENKESCRKKLYIYDRAAVDYVWWDKQKKNNVYMISVLKENAVTSFVETLDFDRNDKVNAGIISYELHCKDKKSFTIVTYKDPETDRVFKFISTLSSSFRPGIIAVLYYKRWTIEKAYNNNKSDLKERKAWSSDSLALQSQMRMTAMTYNLMRLIEEKTKKHDDTLVHPAELKYEKALVKRRIKAKKEGKYVNAILSTQRIARISSFTIRAVKNALLTKMTLATLMDRLIAKLIPRQIRI